MGYFLIVSTDGRALSSKYLKLEAYADIAGEFCDLIKENQINENDMSNVWVRIYKIIQSEYSKILKATTEKEVGRLTGIYLLVRELLNDKIYPKLTSIEYI